jgi:hypothetical protein
MSVFSAFSQTPLEDGDRCFDDGDYACAIEKYNVAFKSSTGKNKQIAEMYLGRARNCAEWLTAADLAFDNEDLTEAEEIYKKILDSNPKDANVKKRLENCCATLSVSKTNLSFSSTGGNESVTVTTTNTETYSVHAVPEWSKVEKFVDNFVITCDPNTGTATRRHHFTVAAGDKTERIYISQTGRDQTTLTVSHENLLFPPAGGEQRITVMTNATTYSVNGLPSWCTVQKYTGYFIVNCVPNSESAERIGNFMITADDKSVRINNRQSGKTYSPPPQSSSPPNTTLSVSPYKLTFPSSGGASEQITVYTNASTYSVSSVPLWCTVQRDNSYFVVICKANSSDQNRSDWFKVTADGREAEVYVSQAGKTNASAQKSNAQKSKQDKTDKCFNCPKDVHRPFGLSLGYVQKQWEWTTWERTITYDMWKDRRLYLEGLHVGVRVEPLFKYGFGLSTGLFCEYYQSLSPVLEGTYSDKSGKYDYRIKFSEHLLYVPLHFQYRLNFSKDFQIFAQAGPSVNYGTGAKFTATVDGEKEPYYTETSVFRNQDLDFPVKRFNTSFDWSAGFRMNGLQLNVGMSYGLINVSSLPEISILQNKPLMASLSWMIPHNNKTIPPNSVNKDDYHSWGLSFGYLNKLWEWKLDNYLEKTGIWENSKLVYGIRFLGITYQPQFIYGFGLFTGLNVDWFFSISDDFQGSYGSYYFFFSEWALHIPLHAEYRLHFSKDFSLFFQTGPSCDVGLSANMNVYENDEKSTAERALYGKTDWGYPTERFYSYWDFSGGFRIKNIQFRVSAGKGLQEVIVDDWKVRQNRNLSLEFSWMFH